MKIAPPAGSAPDDVDVRLAAAEVKIAASTPVDMPAQQELTRLQAASRKFESDRAAQISWAATARENKNQLDLQESELKAKLSEVSRLFGATSSDIAPEVVEKVINITSELEAMANIWGGRIYDVALWTNDMLVLLLVISMGVLGSALHLLAVFVMNEKESMSFGEYPLRLAFGAVTAIVVYIIAKSGLPVLADTTKIGGGAPINPYFISLLAIVSGLMSDRAMDSIRGFATTMLRSLGGADFSQRYIRVDMNEALKTANRTSQGLAKILGLSDEETSKLFSGNDVVSPEKQRLIAAYVNMPIRDLFSDLPAT